jgi:glycosyltransferase involved in cell wall biosynthesis
MVKAFARLNRPDLYMVWLGDGHLRGEIERLVEREGLTGRFLLAGDRTDVASLLPAFDVFAMSSLWEGLPCAVLEAMMCGIPVVATAVNSVPEIVVSGKTGVLARASDPVSLSGALAYVLDHPDEAARMADAAHDHVQEQFRPEQLGEELMGVYDRALAFAAARTDAPVVAA